MDTRILVLVFDVFIFGGVDDIIVFLLMMMMLMLLLFLFIEEDKPSTPISIFFSFQLFFN
jgi:hypothetical protein